LFTAFQGPATHAQLHWEFGPLRYLLVSPVFHSIHHSLARDSADTNFGAVFSCWDYLFGTASARRIRPDRTGVENNTIPENFMAQIMMPVTTLFRSRPAG
jgi:sterol desaturase/sphingolipid hydroxylase (fatty acid hydroxylase superfamily)